jgi:predicted aminopeptidase
MRLRGSRLTTLALLALLSPGVSGCFPVRYVAQAAVGQLGLLLSSRPIDGVLRDPKTSPRVADLLSWVPALKAFGTTRGLKPTQNYTRYTQLHRPAAVWVVQACPAEAFTPRRWQFPLVGTVPYLGFFDEKSARAFAAQLAAADGDLDVDVRAAAAYSTLGWFRDPVLSTMLPDSESVLGELADMVLHESTHATLYLQGQSAFDESLASFVAGQLTSEWLMERFGAGSRHTRAWAARSKRSSERIARLHRAYEDLEALYRSGQPRAEVRRRKAEVLGALEVDLSARRHFNNASLMGFRIYDTGGAAFSHLFAACQHDWRRFFAALGTLSERDFPHPQTEDFSPVVEGLAQHEAER